MEPKQVEQIEAISLKLAATFQTEIKDQVFGQVKSQVAALLEILRDEVSKETVNQVKLATAEIVAAIDDKTRRESAEAEVAISDEREAARGAEALAVDEAKD